MTTLRQSLRRFTATGILLREVRAMRQELTLLTAAVTHIRQELQRRNDHEYGAVLQPNPELPPVTVTYADDLYGVRISDITARLTQAKGMPPSEEEAFDEYLRCYPDSPEALDVAAEQ